MRIGKSDVTDGVRQWMFDWYCDRDFAPSSTVSKPDVIFVVRRIVFRPRSAVVFAFFFVILLNTLFFHPFCRSLHFFLFLSLSFSLYFSQPLGKCPLRAKRQLNDDDTVVITSIHKNKLLFANSMTCYCVFKSDEVNDKTSDKLSIMFYFYINIILY